MDSIPPKISRASFAATSKAISLQNQSLQSTTPHNQAKRDRKRGLCLMVAFVVMYGWNLQSYGQTVQLFQLDQELRQIAVIDRATVASQVPFSAAPILCFMLLSASTGAHPVLVKFFMPEGVIKSTCLLGQETSKFCMSLSFLIASGNWNEATSSWTFESAFIAAGIPAVIFTIQSYFNLMANQVLPPVTFTILNQTKTLSTALFCFLVLDKPQSRLQILALLLLVVSALVNQKVLPLPCEEKTPAQDDSIATQRLPAEDGLHVAISAWDESYKRQLFRGVIPALSASFLSGFAGALTQRTLMKQSRNTHLFNLELAVFSSMFLLATLAFGSSDGREIRRQGFWKGWTWQIAIPIANHAVGGIMVGLVTKHMGAVVKGFSTIFGIIFAGFLQQILLSNRGEPVTLAQFVSGCIGSFSLWLHTTNPS